MKKRMKTGWLLVFPALLLLGLALFFLSRNGLDGWENPEDLSWMEAQRLKREIRNVIKDYPEIPSGTLSRKEIDRIEAQLIQLGYPVEDSDEIYPSWLPNSQALADFYSDASAGKQARTGFLRIREEGDFGFTCLFHRQGETICILVGVGWNGDAPYVCLQETLPVYDMELTEDGTFYYRLYPEDPHYIDYMQLRLQPPHRGNYDLCRKYILPVGYQMVNLFLVDWEEGKWGSLSFPDVFEYLYAQKNGGADFPWTDYADPNDHGRAVIPQELFEETLLPFFHISREELRKQASCREDGYPWRAFFGDDLTTRHFAFCEPVVTGVTEHSDGTFTLYVRVSSPEKKTDCLFAHEVTIRPLPDGGFQYVSNKVTEIGQWGLPYRDSRFMLDF